MKKLFLSFLFFSGAVSAAQAQQSAFGLRAGLNMANYAGSNAGGYDLLAGGLAGITVTSSFNKAATVALQFELLYSGKGATATEADFTFKQRLHYLEMPVLLQLRPKNFELEIGPQFGLLMSQSTELTGKPGNRLASTSTDGFATMQVGYILGGGYRLPQGLGFGLRYNGAINQISSYSGRRNSVFQLQMSYMFKSLRPAA